MYISTDTAVSLDPMFYFNAEFNVQHAYLTTYTNHVVTMIPMTNSPVVQPLRTGAVTQDAALFHRTLISPTSSTSSMLQAALHPFSSSPRRASTCPASG